MGIANNAEVRGLVRRPHRELIEIRFADDNGTVVAEPLDDSCIEDGHKTFEHSRATGGRNPAGGNVVLDGKDHSFQQARCATLEAGIALLRRLARCIRSNSQERAKVAVLLDALERTLEFFRARCFPAVHALTKTLIGLGNHGPQRVPSETLDL